MQNLENLIVGYKPQTNSVILVISGEENELTGTAALRLAQAIIAVAGQCIDNKVKEIFGEK